MLDQHLEWQTTKDSTEMKETPQSQDALQREKYGVLGRLLRLFYEPFRQLPFPHDFYEVIEDYSPHRDGIVLLQKEAICPNKYKWLEETNTFAIRINPKDALEYNHFVAIPVKLSHQTKESPIADAIRNAFPDTQTNDDAQCHQV